MTRHFHQQEQPPPARPLLPSEKLLEENLSNHQKGFLEKTRNKRRQEEPCGPVEKPVSTR